MKLGQWLLVMFIAALSVGVRCANAQEPKEPAADAPAAASPAAPRSPDGEPKPYEKVITKEARSKKGVFTVHWIKSKVYYEIPTSKLGKDFLWVSLISKTTLGVGNGGDEVGHRLVRWEQHENRVLLRSVSYDIVAGEKLPISRAVHAANNDTILMSFNIEAFGKDHSPVIEVTKLFSSEVPEFSARVRLRARGFDTSRSFVERISVYPENIEAEATHTFTSPVDAPAAPDRGQGGMRPGSATVLMHYSMIELPEKPMMPRLADDRVGYHSIEQGDFGQDEHRAAKRSYILRWRLEKKDVNAALSEPVKPIVYYIDPATPEKWRAWLKKGIEDWQPAFEAAGFKNGIIAKDAPTPEQDPDWSPEDVRYSIVRWLPSTTENANGGRVVDPRTGEILSGQVRYYHNIMNLMRDMYFIQAGPLDPRAQKFPLPDDLMGRLVEYVMAHEVGHTLGFLHNMKSSALYPADKIRDKQWLHTMGHVATLMDYSRFNYVAQPEDHIDPADLIPGIGPYDKWATMWGYKPIPGANSPDDEKKTLDEWAHQQDSTPWLRFSTSGSANSDPGENTEAVGDADAVYATALGIRNLHRVMDLLLSATSKPDERYDDLGEIYGRVLGQWVTEMNHVAVIVGGADSQERYDAGPGGIRFTPVSRQRQAAAVEFLNRNAFQTPSFLVRREVLRRIEPVGVLKRMRSAQTSVLSRLLDSARFSRLIEFEALDGNKAYRPVDFLATVRQGIWTELDSSQVKIDAYRRNLQRSYVELLGQKINTRTPGAEEARPYFVGELKTLRGVISRNLSKVSDRETRLHLEDIDDQIGKALDPKFAPPAAAAGGPAQGGFMQDANAVENGSFSCWPDYVIRPN